MEKFKSNAVEITEQLETPLDGVTNKLHPMAYSALYDLPMTPISITQKLSTLWSLLIH
jgi:hypothetical protein